MVQKALTYMEWAEQTRKPVEYGSKAVITDRLLGSARDSVDARIGKRLSSAISRKLADTGYKPMAGELVIERDVELRAIEFGMIVDGEPNKRPDAYLRMAYAAWQEEQDARILWEQKSLWQYLKHWVKRRVAKR